MPGLACQVKRSSRCAAIAASAITAMTVVRRRQTAATMLSAPGRAGPD